MLYLLLFERNPNMLWCQRETLQQQYFGKEMPRPYECFRFPSNFSFHVIRPNNLVRFLLSRFPCMAMVIRTKKRVVSVALQPTPATVNSSSKIAAFCG